MTCLPPETDDAIDAATRKSLLQAHDWIINIIPQIKNLGIDQDQQLQVKDLEKDMTSLFKMYYQSEKGQLPNEALLSVFNEILSQDDKI